MSVKALLQGLCDTPLPQNVLTELQEWSGHSETFVLYCQFGLLEGDTGLEAIEKAAVTRISPSLCIVANP